MALFVEQTSESESEIHVGTWNVLLCVCIEKKRLWQINKQNPIIFHDTSKQDKQGNFSENIFTMQKKLFVNKIVGARSCPLVTSMGF